MKTIRIFISSPGDVFEEREKARQVIRELQRRYLGRLELVPVLWEDLPLQADMSFQRGIDLVLSKEHGIDIAVFIVWSRLGSPLGQRVRKPDGSEYRSGTEREFDLMLQAREQSGGQRPAILAYVRQDDKGFQNGLKDKGTDQLAAMIQQRKAAETFIREQFHDVQSGHNMRAYHTFGEPVSFAVRLRTHLAQLLDELLPEVEPSPARAQWEGSPFRGLQVFEFEHADIFFGRDQAVGEVQLRLGEQAEQGGAFVLIVGASGSGKSSLARAGVLPALVNHHSDEAVKVWRRAVLVPGQWANDLCLGLARVLLEALPELREDDTSLRKLADALRRDPKLAYELRVEGVFQRLGGRLVLLVDQLEEVFTHGAVQCEDLERLFQALAVLARSGSVWVLATVRSDFYAHCQEWPLLMALKEPRGQYDLLPPAAAELRRMITEPVWLAGLRYERNETGESLDQRILDDAAKHPEALPLLEYLLSELYERRTPEGLLSWTAYTELGGVEGALGERAEDLYRRLPVEAQSALGEVLHGLVTVSEQDESVVTRQRVRLEELSDTPEKKTLLGALLQARLLVADRDETGQAVVQVAHEALLRRWERAGRWAAENREFLRSRQRLEQTHRRWVAEEKGGDYLLVAGKPLADAEALVTRHGGWLSEPLKDYVRLSGALARAKEQRRLKRLRMAVAGFAVLALLAAVGFLIARNQTQKARGAVTNLERALEKARVAENKAKNEAERADRNAAEEKAEHKRAEQQKLVAEQQTRNSEARRLLTEANQIMNEQPQDGLLLLVEAMNVHTKAGEQPLLAVEQALLTAFTNTGGLALGGGGNPPITSVATSPDNRWLAAGDWNGSVRLWDLQSSEAKPIARVLPGHTTGINALSISPNGRWLISAAWDGTLGLWEFQGDTVLQSTNKLQGHQAGINAVVISKRSRWLATAGDDGAIKIWDLQATNIPSSVKVFTYNHGAVNALGITSDERWLIAGNDDGTVGISDLQASDIKAGTRLLAGHSGPINAISIGPDDHQIAAASWDGPTLLWSLNAEGNGEGMQVLKGHEHRVNAILHTPDGKRLVTGGYDGTVRVWSLQPGTEGKLPTVLPAHEKGWYTSFGYLLETGEAYTGETIHTKMNMTDLRKSATTEHAARHLRNATGLESFLRENLPLAQSILPLPPTGLRVVSAEAGGVRLVPRDFAVGGVTAMTISADSRWLITAGSDGIVQRWDLSSADVAADRRMLRGHESWISGVAVASEDAYVASASWDGTIRLWALSGTGQSYKALHAHFNHLSQVLNRIPDMVKAAEERSKDQQLPGDLADLAHDVCARNLTRREWDKHFVGQPYRKTFEDLPGPSEGE